MKKIKKEIIVHPPFVHKDTILYIFNFLPIISILAMIRAYPHIREKGWMTAGKIIDRIYEKLKGTVPKTLFSTKFVYTGSKLIEALLGETFNNGKLDVDVLTLASNWKLVRENEYGTRRYHHTHPKGNIYVHNSPLGDNVLQEMHDGKTGFDILICGNSFEQRVKGFDFGICRVYVSPNKLFIAHPNDLLKKTTSCNVDEHVVGLYHEEAVSCRSIESAFNVRMKRLVKYTDRGVSINVVYTHKDANDFRKHCESEGDVNLTDEEFTLFWEHWKECRPPEGIWKNK